MSMFPDFERKMRCMSEFRTLLFSRSLKVSASFPPAVMRWASSVLQKRRWWWPQPKKKKSPPPL